VLHLAWKNSNRGDWYVMAFTSSLEEAKHFVQQSDRVGDYAIRHVVGGRPARKHWTASKWGMRKIYY
jgi:hypothetical protein